MATTNIEGRIGFQPIETPQKPTQFVTTKTFDIGFVLTSLWFMVGFWIDAWAHAHNSVEETFFTPWHAILYSGATSIMVFTGYVAWQNYRRGFRGWNVLPKGYRLSVIGFIIFTVGGIMDMFWHTIFGVEAEVEAAVSPSHLIFGVGMFLIQTGPLRSAWDRKGHFLKEPIPVLLSLPFAMSILTIFSIYANPAAYYHSLIPARPAQEIGLSSVIIWTAIFMGFTLLPIRRWQLPFGSITLMWFVMSIMAFLMNMNYEIFIVTLLAGLAADTLNVLLKPHYGNRVYINLFSAVSPMVYYCLYYAMLIFQFGAFEWTIHLWAGSILLSGIVGLLVSLLMWQPELPKELKF